MDRGQSLSVPGKVFLVGKRLEERTLPMGIGQTGGKGGVCSEIGE